MMSAPLSGKFWSNVVKLPGDGCWEWVGCRDTSGYGYVRLGGGQHKAHRLVWLSEVGFIPDGWKVCHSCDNRVCVRFDHFFCGTQAHNLADRDAKGRGANTRKTHCPRGHEYDEANTYRLDKRRYCRACRS